MPVEPSAAEQRRRRALIGVGAVLLAVFTAVGAAVVAVLDDDEPRIESNDGAGPPGATPPADPPPTPDAAGASSATEALVVTETAWTTTDFGEAQILVLVQHDAADAFVNVAMRVLVIDTSDDVAEETEFTFRRIEPGATAPATTFVQTPVERIARLEVTTTAGGTVPGAAPVRFGDIAWVQDDVGTVTVTGSAASARPHESIAVVAVLRDANGVFAGSAFGVIAGLDASGSPFELLGFPPVDVAAVELYAMT